MSRGAQAALEDLERIKGWRNELAIAAERWDLDIAILAGIMSRESRGRNVIGDAGHGHGLMQIDDRPPGSEMEAWCRAWREQGMDPTANVLRGGMVLDQKRKALCLAIQDPELLLRAAIAAYNCGQNRVMRALREGYGIDHHTTGGDYHRDVFVRAAVFRKEGFV